MFNKGNFSGQFRRTPTVSIGGASKSESREEVIRKAQQERSQREAERSKITEACAAAYIVYLICNIVEELNNSTLCPLNSLNASFC